ncbi:hypothetical protein BC830DRAFT_1109406 [Chytriomyces sp. MP71]|nr:hypothetical protein BC830DRAFT_1109406 [Chytriomyces sp. MP71]
MGVSPLFPLGPGPKNTVFDNANISPDPGFRLDLVAFLDADESLDSNQYLRTNMEGKGLPDNANHIFNRIQAITRLHGEERQLGVLAGKPFTITYPLHQLFDHIFFRIK